MTLSARNSTDCGTVTPICAAVRRLMTNSNFDGRSTGMSAGLAPLSILSRKWPRDGKIRENFRHRSSVVPPRKFFDPAYRRQTMLERKFHDLFAVGGEHRIAKDL